MWLENQEHDKIVYRSGKLDLVFSDVFHGFRVDCFLRGRMEDTIVLVPIMRHTQAEVHPNMLLKMHSDMMLLSLSLVYTILSAAFDTQPWIRANTQFKDVDNE